MSGSGASTTRSADASHTRHEWGEYSFARSGPTTAVRAAMMRAVKVKSLNASPSSVQNSGSSSRSWPCAGHLFSRWRPATWLR
eukprot:1542176-Prymnesium_polylepis.1